MKTMKTIMVIISLALIANIGFAQKNILIHKNYGLDLKINAAGVDSITFTDHATPGTFTLDSYTDATISTNSHGKVIWSASYKGDNTDLCGGFNKSEMDLLFDEANPANIKFFGRAKLSTANTFEPARDGPGHCVNTSLNVTWYTHNIDTVIIAADTIISGPDTTFIAADTSWTTVYDSTVVANDWAELSADPGDVVAFGDDYMATADFTYRGVTGSVDVLLVYMGSTSQSPTRNYHNFKATFSFMAGASSGDDWYCGGNIKSLVRVQINCVFQEDF